MRTRHEPVARTVTRICPECKKQNRISRFDVPAPGYCHVCSYDPEAQKDEIAADAALAERILSECDSVANTVIGGRQYSLWPLPVAGSLAEEIVKCCKVPHRFARLRDALAEKRCVAAVMSKAQAFDPHQSCIIGVALEDGDYLVIV